MKKSISEDRAAGNSARRERRSYRRIVGLAAVMGIAGLLCAGCSVLSYSSPSGEHFSRLSLGVKTAIAALNVEAGTNGVRRLQLQGYQTDANQALGTVTEAAVRAAITH
jgi:hypothetical protein